MRNVLKNKKDVHLVIQLLQVCHLGKKKNFVKQSLVDYLFIDLWC